MLEVEALSALNDNYIWLLKNNETKLLTVIDPGDATPVLKWLQQNQEWKLTDILITHHHQDHVGGIPALVKQTAAQVSAPDTSSIPHKDRILHHSQLMAIHGVTVQVIAVPGHTLDHISFYLPEQPSNNHARLFCGDTLFSGGCGRVFEGTMEQMYQSLQLLDQLPAETLIYPAHEYTLDNLKFAALVEPKNDAIKTRLEKCTHLRANKQATLPSTLSIERQTNPFLRCTEPNVKNSINNHLKQSVKSESEVFSGLRNWKNSF